MNVVSNKKTRNYKSARELTKIAVLTALMLVSPFFKIPLVPVPMTLQSFVAILAGLMLGPKGAIVPAIYLLMGFCGVPVFANGGGIAYLLQPTCGFTFGFVLAAYLAGLISRTKGECGYIRLILACSVATVALYVCGIAYTLLIQIVYMGKTVNFMTILTAYWLVFIPSDIVKAAAAIFIVKAVRF